MSPKEITQVYLEALRTSHLEQVIQLFSENGKVHSPIYGSQPASDFYKMLFQDTQRSQLALKGVFAEMDNPNEFAIYFTYQWTLANGEEVQFDVVDVIQLNEEGRIENLTIIYDTQHSRPAVTALGNKRKNPLGLEEGFHGYLVSCGDKYPSVLQL